jgi:T-complex protein 1 subunit alpha
MLESNSLVAGGGAVEAALSIYLDGLATSMGSREQLAVAQVRPSPLYYPYPGLYLSLSSSPYLCRRSCL